MAQLPPLPIYPPLPPYTVSDNIFGNTFTKNFTADDVKDVFKSLAEVTPVARRIRLLPRVKTNTRAFNAWIKHLYRLCQNPAMIRYDPNVQTERMMEISAHMKRFTSNKLTTSSVAKPNKFSKDIDWRDWAPTVVNCFRMIPGSDGVPLSYILRDNDGTDPICNNFTDELKDRMRQERSDYNRNRTRKGNSDGESQVIKEMKRQMDNMASIISSITKKDSSNGSQISEMNTGTITYGGKAEANAFKRRDN